jgi:hypothetical protein
VQYVKVTNTKAIVTSLSDYFTSATMYRVRLLSVFAALNRGWGAFYFSGLLTWGLIRRTMVTQKRLGDK